MSYENRDLLCELYQAAINYVNRKAYNYNSDFGRHPLSSEVLTNIDQQRMDMLIGIFGTVNMEVKIEMKIMNEFYKETDEHKTTE